MAGHDYLHAGDPVLQGQDWGKCLNNTRHMGAVLGAVNEFVMLHDLQLSVTWGENHTWRSWMFRKPPQASPR